MAVKDYSKYIITDHAKERILTRFNITNRELDPWLTRLMKQCHFVEKQDNGNTKYRLNDVVLIANSRQKKVVTVYSLNEIDDQEHLTKNVNPEVRSFMTDSLNNFLSHKRIETARRVNELVEHANYATQRMVKPGTNLRYSDVAWDEFMKDLNEINKIVNTSNQIMKEATEQMGGDK